MRSDALRTAYCRGCFFVIMFNLAKCCLTTAVWLSTFLPCSRDIKTIIEI